MSEIPLDIVEEHDNLGVRLHHKLSWSPILIMPVTK